MEIIKKLKMVFPVIFSATFLLALYSIPARSTPNVEVRKTTINPADISQMHLIAKKESEEHRTLREEKINNIIQSYKLKIDEPYVYLSPLDNSGLKPYQILYRNYNVSDKNSYIYLDEKNATGKVITVSDDIKPLANIDKHDYNARISPSILKRRPGIKDNEKTLYFEKLKVTMLHRIIDSGVCATIYSADVYNFGGTYVIALCGDGMEIDQSQQEIENNVAPERVLKDRVMLMSHEKRVELMNRSR